MTNDSSLRTPEFYVIFGVSIILTIVCYIFIKPHDVSNVLIQGLMSNLSLLATVLITLAGFFLTALSILIVLPNNQSISLMKENPNYGVVNRFFLSTIFEMFALFVASVVGTIIKPNSVIYYYGLLFGLLVMIGMVTVSLLTFARLVETFH